MTIPNEYMLYSKKEVKLSIIGIESSLNGRTTRSSRGFGGHCAFEASKGALYTYAVRRTYRVSKGRFRCDGMNIDAQCPSAWLIHRPSCIKYVTGSHGERCE